MANVFESDHFDHIRNHTKKKGLKRKNSREELMEFAWRKTNNVFIVLII